jgi:ubiquinone/menaquinone biosynthesis C-methylase UbiE
MPDSRSTKYDQAIAATYDRRYEQNDYSEIQRCLLEFIGNNNLLDVLEVGCGTGHWLTFLSEKGYRISGLEPSANMLFIAKNKLPDSLIVQGCAESLPWQAASFDRVFGINTFHHFTNPHQFMDEAHRILRSGGGLMILGLDPNQGMDSWWLYDYFPQVFGIDKKRHLPTYLIQQMLRDSGFVNCKTVEAQHIFQILPARFALESGRLDKNS